MPREKEPLQLLPAIEGAYIQRGPREIYAVRTKDGSINVRVARTARRSITEHIPLLRGVTRLARAVRRPLGIYAVSQRMRPQQLTRPSADSAAMARALRLPRLTLTALRCTLMVLLCVVAFALLPLLLELALVSWPPVLRALTLCVVRVGLLLGTVFVLSRMKFLRRISMCRGAANKVSECVRARRRLTIESTLTSRRIAAESDAAFLLLLGILLIICGAALPLDFSDVFLRVAVRVLLVLVLAAVVNEIIRPIERRPDSLLHRPLEWLQRTFTVEPHSEMLEVAITAVKAARGEIHG